MAYITTEAVAQKRKALKEAFPGWKFSVRREHHSSLNVAIISAPISFGSDYSQVNHYHLNRSDRWSDEQRNALSKIVDVCMEDNHDNSDINTDYFDVGWYFNLSIGQYDKPFVQKAK